MRRSVLAARGHSFRPRVDGSELEHRSLPSGVTAAVHNGSGTISARDDLDISTPTQYGPLRTTVHFSMTQNYKANGTVVQTASYSRRADRGRGYAFINGKRYYGLFTEVAQGSIKNQSSRFALRFALDVQGNVHVNFAKANINETVTNQFTVNGKTYTMSKGTRSEWFGSAIQFGTYPSGILPKQINGHANHIDPGTGEHVVTTWKFNT